DGMPAYGACCRRDVERPGVLVGQPVAGLVTQERVLLHADPAMSELHGLVGSRGRVAADLEQPVAGAGGGGELRKRQLRSERAAVDCVLHHALAGDTSRAECSRTFRPGAPDPRIKMRT